MVRGDTNQLDNDRAGRVVLGDICVSAIYEGIHGSRNMARSQDMDCCGYLRGQRHWLVNYAQRHRAGLPVGTAITEGTANFLVNRRMNKSQQMRWSRRGADLLLQVRCAVYNGAFGSTNGRRFKPAYDSCSPMAIAA